MDYKSEAKASADRKKAALCGDTADGMPGSQSTEPLRPFGASGKADPSNRVPGRAMGGRIMGEAAGENLGQSARSSGKAGKGKTVVNVIVAPQSAPQPMPVPVPAPPMPDGALGGMPSVADKPAAGLPVMTGGAAPAMPAPPMPSRASGGRVGKFTGGAAGGRGRLEKTEHAKRDRDHDKDDR